MQKILEVKGLTKTYITQEGPMEALSDLSLSVDSGEIFGIIGLSGAGKSTLIRCLAQLDIPTDGRITFSGDNLCCMSKTELREFRKKIGMIFQHFNLLSSRTVYGNIAYPLEMFILFNIASSN